MRRYDSLVSCLRRRNIALTADGTQLRCRGPSLASDATLLPALMAHKAKLLADLLAGGIPWVAAAPSATPGPREPYQKRWAGLPLVVLDLETYYDQRYNLKKCNVVPYTFAPDFLLHGIAVRYPDGTTEFRTDAQALISEIRAEYGEHLENVAVVFHHGYFDYFILYHRLGLRLANIVDTMLLARLAHGPVASAELKELATRYSLPPKGDLEFMKGVRNPSAEQAARLREYAARDAEITGTLAEILLPPVFSRTPIELWAIDHSVRQFVERPLVIDTATVGVTRALLGSAVAEAFAATGHSREEISGTISFHDLLGRALSKTGRSVPMKSGKKGPVLALAKGDPERDALLVDDDEDVRRLVAAKVLLRSSVDAGTRLAYLTNTAELMAGRCPFLHNYHAAGTGRFAGGQGFNIQNLKDPSRAEESDVTSGLIRSAIRAESGCVFVSADAAQIEARVLSFMAGQLDLHDAFARGIDVYSEFASAQFHREVRKPMPDDTPGKARELELLRQVGKGAILGLGYNMGPERFIHQLKKNPLLRVLFRDGVLSESICCGIVWAYRQRYPAIVDLWSKCGDAFRRALQGDVLDIGAVRFSRGKDMDEIRLRLPSGRDLVYPEAGLEPPTFRQHRFLDRYGIWQTVIDDRPSLAYAGGVKLYGGKIVENIVQAVARDILVDVMYRLEASGRTVVHHCHDSITVMTSADRSIEGASAMVAAWRSVPAWMPGLILDAEAMAGPSLGEMSKSTLVPRVGAHHEDPDHRRRCEL